MYALLSHSGYDKESTGIELYPITFQFMLRENKNKHKKTHLQN